MKYRRDLSVRAGIAVQMAVLLHSACILSNKANVEPLIVDEISVSEQVMQGPLYGMNFVTIHSGSFTMGSPDTEVGRGENEHLHTVEIQSFQLMTTEVTQSMWEQLMGENPSCFVSPNRPVEQVTWADCQIFIEKLNSLDTVHTYRLPTEAEWEYACRAGTVSPIYLASMNIEGLNNCLELDTISWYGGNSGVSGFSNGVESADWEQMQYTNPRSGTHPVGLKQPNSWGLYDMIGNVWEWCADLYIRDNTDISNGDDQLSEDSDRVFRGGSWASIASLCRSATRYYGPGLGCNRIGFRVARTTN